MEPNNEAAEIGCEKSPKTSQHEMQALQQDRCETLDTECSNDITGDNHLKNEPSISSLKSPSTISYIGDISNEKTVSQLHPQSALSHPQFEYAGLHRRSASTPWDSIGNENPMPLSVVENFAHKASQSLHIWVHSDSDVTSVESSTNNEREQRELELIVKKL